MCNIWTGEHVFIWNSGTKKTNPGFPENFICQCGAFRFDGQSANITYADYQYTYREIKIDPKYIVGDE